VTRPNQCSAPLLPPPLDDSDTILELAARMSSLLRQHLHAGDLASFKGLLAMLDGSLDSHHRLVHAYIYIHIYVCYDVNSFELVEFF
jgi:hypothetical protein